MWLNPPPEVTALRTMLVASSTWSTLAGAAATSSVHYPDFAAGDSPTPDVLPLLLIDPSSDAVNVMAPGVLLPEGTLTVMLRMAENAVSQATTIEVVARAIAYEVANQLVGLPITGTKVGMASKPTAAERAAQATSDADTLGETDASRDIAIIFTYKIG
jgi:hypothetical protein